MNKTRKFHKAEFVGTFENIYGMMIAADPCYNNETVAKEHGGIDHALVGTWHAFVRKADSGIWGIRVESLLVIHESYLDAAESDLRCSRKKYGIPVDSGQAGFYDAYHHHDNSVVPRRPKANFGHPWYNMCCDATNFPNYCGVVPYGVVSRSGYGDGYYPAYIWRNGRKVVAIEIEFIEEE